MRRTNSRSIITVFLVTLLTFGNSFAQDIKWDRSNYGKNLKGLEKVVSINANPLLEGYDVKFYKLDVYADTLSSHIEGNVTILVEVVNNPLSILVLELIDRLNVEKVLIDGVETAFSHTNDEINITLPSQVPVGELISAQVFYGGTPGEGMGRAVDKNWGMTVTYTLSEPFYARDWFPCKQNLADKADSVHVFITTDYGLTAASNGILTGTTYFPNGDVRYEWKSNYPIAFYLISLAIADYTEYNIEANPEGLSPISIQNFVYDLPGCLDYYKDQINMTAAVMELYCDLFGPYPFRDEKYGHYQWPWGGGMEHQTMTGMGGFSLFLVSHELGHSWFGNYVTCATWQDIWINEGFASYTTYLAYENLVPESAAGELEYRFGRALREPEGSVFIPDGDDNSDSRIFSSNLSYSKGMAIIHMIRFVLDDDEIFFRVLKDFINEYADSVATGMDFKDILESVSGLDFTDFFDQWYFGFGFPMFDVSWNQVGQTVTIYSDQTTSSAQTTLFKTPMEYKLFYDGGDTIVRVNHEINNEVYTFDLNHTVTDLIVDPNNNVLDQVLVVKQLTGIPNNESGISFYPNPTNGVLYLELIDAPIYPVAINIFNDIGQVIYSGNYGKIELNPLFRLDLTDYSPGMYFIKIESGNNVEVGKIILK